MSNLEIVFTLCIPILLVGLGMGMKTKTPKKIGGLVGGHLRQ